MPLLQAFVADCTAHFHRMQVKQSWADTDFRNGAEAMAAILEVMRRHEVRQGHWSMSPSRPWATPSCRLADEVYRHQTL